MVQEKIITTIDHKKLLNDFVQYALLQLGELKIKDISNKVNSSKKINDFLIEIRNYNGLLSTNDFVSCIHSSISFTFAKSETIAIASIFLLIKWENETSKPLSLSSQEYLNRTFFSILDKCDGFKLHINNSLNFFERFYKKIEDEFIEIPINLDLEIKTEIHFDTLMCKAIKDYTKSEFRTIDNLEIINLMPNEWVLEKIDLNNGAQFKSNNLDETIVIPFPYKMGNKIIVRDKHSAFDPAFEIKLMTVELQRIRDVNQLDAINEGYSVYENRVDDILEKYYDADAELCLFEEDWANKYGDHCKAINQWIWVFGFYPIPVD